MDTMSTVPNELQAASHTPLPQQGSANYLDDSTRLNRVLATKEQLVLLEALHESSQGRATKEEIVDVSQRTGLEVKWIRKWLSRRRCRSKSTSTGVSPRIDYSPQFHDRSQSANAGLNDTSLYPSMLSLLGDFLSASAAAVPGALRPDFSRSVSAPAVPTRALPFAGPATGKYPIPLADNVPHMRSVTTPPAAGLASASATMDFCSALLSSGPAGTPIPPHTQDTLHSPYLPELSYPCREQYASDGSIDPNSLTLMHSEPSSPYPSYNLSTRQSAMLSALGLQLASPDSVPGSVALDALLSMPIGLPPSPHAAQPVSFQVRLADLATRGEQADKMRIESHQVQSVSENDQPVSEPSTPGLIADFEEFMESGSVADEEDGDEAVTPGESHLSGILELPGPEGQKLNAETESLQDVQLA